MLSDDELQAIQDKWFEITQLIHSAGFEFDVQVHNKREVTGSGYSPAFNVDVDYSHSEVSLVFTEL